MFLCFINNVYHYCVVASTGRFDRVFQILPEQEEGISVGDMLSDGILIVEYDDGNMSGDVRCVVSVINIVLCCDQYCVML